MKEFSLLRTSLVLLGFVVALSFWVHSRTDGFCLAICQPVVGRCAVEPALFSCPDHFVYIGRGKQAFVFESEDGETILKLFDRSHLDTPWYAKIPGIFSKRKKRSEHRSQIFPHSYRLAFDCVPEETGLLSVHLGRSTSVWPTVQLTDKASRKFLLNLNEVAFVFQKKGEGTLLERLSQARADETRFKSLLEQYIALHAKRISQCVADRDRDIQWNYAWKEGKLLYIDPARFFYEEKLKEPDYLKHEWWGCTYRLRRWITKHSPETISWYDARVNEEIKKVFCEEAH